MKITSKMKQGKVQRETISWSWWLREPVGKQVGKDTWRGLYKRYSSSSSSQRLGTSFKLPKSAHLWLRCIAVCVLYALWWSLKMHPLKPWLRSSRHLLSISIRVQTLLHSMETNFTGQEEEKAPVVTMTLMSGIFITDFKTLPPVISRGLELSLPGR